MCKYCKTAETECGEKTAQNNIAKIKDGSQIIEVFLNRYIIDEDNISDAQIILELNCETMDSGLCTVKQKEVKIKYCPFCGEEL